MAERVATSPAAVEWRSAPAADATRATSPADRASAGLGARTAQSLAGNWVLFRQGDHGYLLPGDQIQSVVSLEHLRRLPRPVAGWAGTVAAAGGAIPVLDAGALLGHGGAAREIVVLQVAGVGPFGLAVDQLAGLQRLPAGALTAVRGAGLAGGVVLGDEVVLALDAQFLGGLRRAAVGRDESRRPIPLPVSWQVVAEPAPSALAHPPIAASEPLLVLAEPYAAEPERQVALPLRAAPTVASVGAIRPGPPGSATIAGYGVWNERVLAAIPLASYAGIGRAEEAHHAVLLTDPRGTTLFALLVAPPRGVQWPIELSPPPTGAPEGVQALGQTAQGPVAVWDPTWLGEQAG